jgi:hypothetical protein
MKHPLPAAPLTISPLSNRSVLGLNGDHGESRHGARGMVQQELVRT